MAAIPSAQGQTLAADTSADVVSIETLRASVAGQLVTRRDEYARVTAELTSHNRRGAAHAHERQAALEATIARLAPELGGGSMLGRRRCPAHSRSWNGAGMVPALPLHGSTGGGVSTERQWLVPWYRFAAELARGDGVRSADGTHRRVLLGLRRLWVEREHAARLHSHVPEADQYLELKRTTERLLRTSCGEVGLSRLILHWRRFDRWVARRPAGSCPVCARERDEDLSSAA